MNFINFLGIFSNNEKYRQLRTELFLEKPQEIFWDDVRGEFTIVGTNFPLVQRESLSWGEIEFKNRHLREEFKSNILNESRFYEIISSNRNFFRDNKYDVYNAELM